MFIVFSLHTYSRKSWILLWYVTALPRKIWPLVSIKYLFVEITVFVKICIYIHTYMQMSKFMFANKKQIVTTTNLKVTKQQQQTSVVFEMCLSNIKSLTKENYAWVCYNLDMKNTALTRSFFGEPLLRSLDNLVRALWN